MSDQDQSGAPASASADSPAPASTTPVAPVSAPAVFGSFGENRGSGLLRGKRPAVASASASTPAAPSGYKPSALEVITPASEYKNPFTGETSVSAPRANEPVAPTAPVAPAPVAPTPLAAAPVAPAAVARAEPVPAATHASERPAINQAPTEPAIKAELNILPPESSKRPAVHWEAPTAAGPSQAQPAPRTDDRPTFQPRNRSEGRDGRDARPFEPRDGRPSEPRDGRGDRRGDGRGEGRYEGRGESRDQRGRGEPRGLEPREPRREDRKFEPRSNQPYRDPLPAAEPEKKSAGFFGWFKGLFRRKKKAEAPSTNTAPQAADDSRRDGRYGGSNNDRGRGGYRGDQRGPRDPNGQQQAGRGESRGEGQYNDEFGGPRRRRRGGRGRSRGEGGSERGGDGGGPRGPRPEGQQGGGAI
ncbi:MAG: hypothetical protein RL077_6245 [Verrucomicrobiota bacterium]